MTVRALLTDPELRKGWLCDNPHDFYCLDALLIQVFPFLPLCFLFFLLSKFFFSCALAPLCNVVSLLLQAEQVPCTVNDFRVKNMLIQRLAQTRYLLATPELHRKIVINYLLGVFHVNFSMIWPQAEQMLVTWAGEHAEEVWQALQAKLEATFKITSSVVQRLRSDLLGRVAAAQTVNALRHELTELPTAKALAEAEYDTYLGFRLRPSARDAAVNDPSAPAPLAAVFAKHLQADPDLQQLRVDAFKVHSLLSKTVIALPELGERHNRYVEDVKDCTLLFFFYLTFPTANCHWLFLLQFHH